MNYHSDDDIIESLLDDLDALERDYKANRISKRLYEEINERILIPYMTEDRFWWMAFNANDEKSLVNNWNTWCNSNILQCFLI